LVGATRGDTAADEREHRSEGDEIKESEYPERYGCIVAREEEFKSKWPDQASYSGSGYQKVSTTHRDVI